VKDPLEEAGSDVTRRGAGISFLLVLLGLIVLAILRPSTIDTLAIILGIVALIMLHEAGHYFTAKRAGMKVTEFFLGFGPRGWPSRRTPSRPVGTTTPAARSRGRTPSPACPHAWP